MECCKLFGDISFRKLPCTQAEAVVLGYLGQLLNLAFVERHQGQVSNGSASFLPFNVIQLRESKLFIGRNGIEV